MDGPNGQDFRRYFRRAGMAFERLPLTSRFFFSGFFASPRTGSPRCGPNPHPSGSFVRPPKRSAGVITTARDTDTRGYLYLGCFEDDEKRVFSGKKYVDAHMTTKVKLTLV